LTNIGVDQRPICESRKYSASRRLWQSSHGRPSPAGHAVLRATVCFNSELVDHILILSRRQAMPESAIPAYITSLIRHFEDLRDGTHGGSVSRKDKEAHFEKEVQLLAPIARRVLTEMNTNLLLNTGQRSETRLRRTEDGGLNASWGLSWREQRAAGVQPIV